MTQIWPSIISLRTASPAPVNRCPFVGGSDANVILSGDPNRIMRLWHEKRGECEAEELSDFLPAMLGCWTEAFNRQWYERLTGRVVDRIGEHVTSRDHSWRRCTLDGFIGDLGAIWEGKHTNAFIKPEEALERYMPQLQHNMAVTGAGRAVLSVIFGNHRFEVIEIESDWLYQDELLKAETDFWDCVQTGRKPIAVTPPQAPKPTGIREVCLEGNNRWASAAFDWLENRAAAKTHSAAATLIKTLVEDDVARAFGHGIEAKRSKAGAITIKELA